MAVGDVVELAPGVGPAAGVLDGLLVILELEVGPVHVALQDALEAGDVRGHRIVAARGAPLVADAFAWAGVAA